MMTKGWVMNKGDRVGAILYQVGEVVHFLGYGVLEGIFKPPYGPLKGMPNPRIKLDNGKIVWGYQCWFGPEEMIKKQLKDLLVLEVSV
jgi:hypothetical protein